MEENMTAEIWTALIWYIVHSLFRFDLCFAKYQSARTKEIVYLKRS